MIQLTKVAHIALGAGNIIRKHYTNNKPLVAQKSDGSPVTDADLAAQEHICEGLSKIEPSIPIISEEGNIPDYSVRKFWQRFWLVDPLDGTKEFINRTDEFTVNIAMIQDGVPHLGVIYVPVKNVIYFAQAGKGSWKQCQEADPERLYSRFPDPSKELVVVESRSHANPRLETFLASYKVKSRIKAGSSLKFCLVAEGKADIYPRLGPTMEWDVAAGDCIYRNSARTGQHPVMLDYNKPSLRNTGFVIGLAPGTFSFPT